MKPVATHGSYVAGFILSVVFTVGAYLLVAKHTASDHTFGSHTVIIGAIVLLGLAQLIVQLILFLHLGREAKPRWQLWAFGFMALVLIILVAGSLWIMQNLNYNMESSADTDTMIMQDEGVHPVGEHHH